MSAGFVAIGRNEGERLHACLRSCVKHAGLPGDVVYVDSGSTDGSVAFAESLGVSVVALDMNRPFTAARARNEGWRRLLEIAPGSEFVQFLDGDCELRDEWVETAKAALESNEKLAVVCGRRRERFPGASIYNRLCDMEWDTPIGEAKYCGGDALFRESALREVGGYDDTLIAGEEPELCVRLRMADWMIERLDAEMTWHDAAMTEFGQFWKRSKRAGHAYAEGNAKHGGPPMHHWDKEVKSIAWWGIRLPAIVTLTSVAGLLLVLVALGIALSGVWGGGPMADAEGPTAATWWVLGLALAGLLVTLASTALSGLYVVLLLKVWKYRQDRGDASKHALLYAASVVVGKFANAAGVRMYRRNRKAGKIGGLIEYKGGAAVADGPRSETVGFAGGE
ncbi:MAG: glycosyltransferase family A protein [Planctomycetota bacterium]